MEARMQTKTLDVLFEETLRDMYYAERKILRTLPKLARTAQSPDLRAAFKTHAEETQLHVDRLKQVFELLGKPARGKNCPAIDGIIEEGEEVMQAFAGSPALDAGLIAAAQAVEHYEITRYGTLVRWAQVLGLTDMAKILEQTLQEETMTDETLTLIADGSVNQAALQAA
jgi:ferritin-like metal-binding protein YciE